MRDLPAIIQNLSHDIGALRAVESHLLEYRDLGALMSAISHVRSAIDIVSAARESVVAQPDTSDIPEATEDFFKAAKLVRPEDRRK